MSAPTTFAAALQRFRDECEPLLLDHAHRALSEADVASLLRDDRAPIRIVAKEEPTP